MLNRVIADQHGRIVAATAVNDDVDASAEAEMYAARGLFVLPVSHVDYPSALAALRDESFYVDDGVLVARPTPPGSGYAWSWSERAWRVAPEVLTACRDEKKASVTAIAEQLRVWPVAYDGVRFDADPASVENMVGLTRRIERGDGLTPGWVGWRTYENTMVWADASAALVLDHLYSIARLLESRRQYLLIVSWGHKAALDQLDTVEAISAYDIEAGWPA